MNNYKKISEIQFHNFRSYTNEIFKINKNANLIILFGNNGLGKTAFFDGIEWGLTGTLRRYNKPAKEKHEYPILSNVFKEEDKDSYVEILFDDKTNIIRKVISKTGKDFNPGVILNNYNIDGNLVDNFYKGYVSFEDNFAFSQFLSQELISMFIRGTKDTDRYESLVNLFGLSKYNQYNSFMKNVISTAFQRKEKLSASISETEKELKLLENNITSDTINVKIKENELNSISIRKIDFLKHETIMSNIEAVKEFYREQKLTLNKSLEIYKLKHIDFEYLNNRFKENERIVSNINELNIQKKSLKEHIEILEKYQNLDYVLKNKDAYTSFKGNYSKVDILEEIFINKQKTYELLHNILTDSRDESIYRLNDISMKKNQAINEYIELKASIGNTKQYMNELEAQLHEKSTIKQEFLRITIKHLQNNTTLSECPICSSAIDINSILNKLVKEINQESDSIFNDLRKRIDICRENIAAANQKLRDLRQSIQSSTKDLLEEVRNDIINIEKELKGLKEDKKIYGKVSQILNQYDIDIDQAFIAFDAMSQYIRENTIADNLDAYGHQYTALNLQTENLSESIQKYLGLKNRYKINSLEEITEKLDKLNASIEACNLDIVNADTVIRLCEELTLYYKNYFAKFNIISLSEKLQTQKREAEALDKIIDSYKNLSENVRSSVEEQTQKVLKLYGNTIKRVYRYLNPNLKFADFDIRIDNENPKNNRMILEVAGSNGAKINPSYSFSAAQNNVLAVSLFLSFAITQRWSKLNCIFMDDPIQNMDDINIHNFVDILRNIIKKTNKQIFVSTHDERIFKYMKNKFRSNIQTFEFTDYGKIKSDSY